jgi:hypothetical protein
MEKKFPKKVEIIAATNGYLINIGCQNFVFEGEGKDFTDLLKYLNCDEDIPAHYGYKGTDAYIDSEPQAEMAECKTPSDFASCPAFDYLRNTNNIHLPRKVKEIYKATNGTITVDYENYTVMVEQVIGELLREVERPVK